MKCDLCDAPTPNCPPFATYCQRQGCGYYGACAACCKEHGSSVQGKAWRAHERRHKVRT